MAESENLRRCLAVVRGLQEAISPDMPVPVGATAADVRLPDLSTRDAVRQMTAFISWAHSHGSWTKDQTTDWESQVAAFASILRRMGIAAEVDLFHLDEPQDWTRYGPQQVQIAAFTLIVLSKAWAERWSGTNAPREGAGAAAEADTLRGLFAHDQEAWQRRTIVVMFPNVDADVVPPDLQRVARVSLDPVDRDSYEPLVRMLTSQPRYPKPPVGQVPVFDAAAGYQSPPELTTLRTRLDEIDRRRREIGGARSRSARAERERLDLSEAATRGFIDAQLTVDD